MTTETSQVAPETLQKEARLKGLLAGYGSIAIAYSGGVDSTYLADVAHEALGDKARLVLADSPSVPRSEMAEAAAVAEERGWHLTVLHTEEFENEDFLKNDAMRCYFCKVELFEKMRAYAAEHDVAVLAYGENADDKVDLTRMGVRAAAEYAVVAPLHEVGLGKAEIRQLSARRNLPTWNKASFACLSSRFPIGARLTLPELQRVEKAEETLKSLGFRQYRARHHGDLCRIEIDPADMDKMLNPGIREQVIRALTDAGYRYVTLDLAGYRTGSTAGDG